MRCQLSWLTANEWKQIHYFSDVFTAVASSSLLKLPNYGSLPRSRFLDVTQALRDIQKKRLRGRLELWLIIITPAMQVKSRKVNTQIIFVHTLFKPTLPPRLLGEKNKIKLRRINFPLHSFFFFYKNVVFLAQAEYSYFSADFRLKIFLYYS